MPSSVKPVPKAALLTWPTKRLLALRDRLLRCEADLASSDIQRAEEIEALGPSLIRFESDPRWTELHRAITRLLTAREHVPGGDVRSTRRKARASEGRARERSMRAPKPWQR